MSKKVDEFVKNAKEMDEQVFAKLELADKLNEQINEIAEKRTKECEEFFNSCTDEEFNELLSKVEDEDKLMYSAMRVASGVLDSLKKKLEEKEKKEDSETE